MFGNIFKAIGGLFGRRDEEDERRKQQEARSNTPRPTITATAPPRSRLPAIGAEPEPVVPLMPSITNRPKPQDTRHEIDRLTDKYYEDAKKTANQGNNLVDNVVNFFSRDDEKLAANIARTRAVNEFNERTNYQRTDEARPYLDETINSQREMSRDLDERAKRTQNQRDYMEEWVNTASNVPIIGSIPAGVVKMGTTLVGGAAAGTGNERYANELNRSLTRMQLGMSQEELDALPEEQRRKLQILQQVDIGAAPLDFLGVTGVGKSLIFPTVKNAVKEQVIKGAISAATRQAVKDAAKKEAIPTILSGVAGGGIDAGVQQYLTGEVDPMQVLNSTITSAFLAPLLNESPTQNRNKVSRAVGDAVDEAPNITRVDAPEIETPTIRPTTDPDSAISVKPRTQAPPAITSPNRPATPPVPTPAPAPLPPPQAIANVLPEPAVVPDPVVTTTNPPEVMNVIEPEVLPEPPVVVPPEPPVAQNIETPLQAQSRAIAEQTTPVSPEAIAQANAAARAAQAPGRTLDIEVPEGAAVQANDGFDPSYLSESVTNSFLKNPEGKFRKSGRFEGEGYSYKEAETGKTITGKDMDGRIVIGRNDKGELILKDGTHLLEAHRDRNIPIPNRKVRFEDGAELPAKVDETPVGRADARVAKHIENAKETGVDYDALVAKAYSNSLATKDGKMPTDLTPAETKVWKEVNKDINQVKAKLNRLGILDEDLGHIVGNYLPTAKAGEAGRVEGVADVAARDFGFAKTREGKLSDDEVKAGARQALEDYLRVGELVDDLSPEQIDNIKKDSLYARTLENLEGAEDAPHRMTPSDDEISKIRSEIDQVIAAERRVNELNDKIEKGDTSPETLSARNEAISDAHEASQNKVVADFLRLQESTKKAVDDIKKSTSLTPGQKKERIDYLTKNLDNKEYQTRYLQSYTRSNVLFQVPGRIADQANKAAQAIGDTTTGVLGRLADSKVFKEATGRDIRADRATVKDVMGRVKGDPRLNPRKNSLAINKKIADAQSKSAAGRLASRYRIYATAATEMGSREGRPIRNTVSYFVAKAQAEGINDINQITRYVQDAIDGKEWKRVHSEFYRESNRFTGVPLHRRNLDGTLDTADSRVDAAFSKIDRGIEAALAKTGMNRRMQREVGDAIRIPLVGFPRVVFNLGSKGFDYATFGAKEFIQASKITPTDEASALRKALMMRSAVESAQSGAAIGAMGMMLGAGGMVSGAYPEDASERRRWETEGKQPFSIKMTGPDGKDHWFDVSRYIGPYAFPFLLGAQMGNGGLNPGDTAQMVGNIAKQVSLNFGTEAVSDFLAIASQLASGDIGGAAEEAQRYLPNMISMGIPLSGQLNAVGRATDEFQRETKGDGLFDTIRRGIQRKIPGLRDDLEAKTDAFGKPLAEDPLGAFLPTYGGNQDVSDPIRTELSRLAEAGVEAYPAGVSGNARNFTLKDAEDKNIALNAKQQSDLNNAVKQEKAHQAELIMNSESYQAASDQEKGEMLKKLYSLDNSGVAAQWAKDNGISGVKDTAEKINNSLDDPLQQAIVEYKLQGDKKDVWLDDIDNAARYYEADYKNAEANGTLEYDDQHLDKTSSKKYKMVAAQTNKEFGADRDLIALYENINKTEFKDMPDSEQKRRLLAFDLARTAKGVSLNSSDHSKSKYGYNADGSLASSGKGRGKTTVNLPSVTGSLRGAGTPAKYAEGGRLYSPKLALEAPERAATTKSPTISVKRGVHL